MAGIRYLRSDVMRCVELHMQYPALLVFIGFIGLCLVRFVLACHHAYRGFVFDGVWHRGLFQK